MGIATTAIPIFYITLFVKILKLYKNIKGELLDIGSQVVEYWGLLVARDYPKAHL